MAQFKISDGRYNAKVNKDGGLNVSFPGSVVAEQKTQADATTGIITFSEVIEHLEIYNTDAANDGVFAVNGINITVPKGEAFKASYGGIASAEVAVTGSTSYILTRYE